MDIGVFYDIHSNHFALEACIEYIDRLGINHLILGGDYLGDMAYPRKTMNLIYQLRASKECIFIKGNKEDYWLDYRRNGEKGWKEYSSTTGCLYNNYYSLTSEDFDFFEGLDFTREVAYEGLPTITVCHGSPRKVREPMKPTDEWTRLIMEQNPNSTILCGHTHRQGRVEHKGKQLLNAGSVGLPLEDEKRAHFMILHGEHGAWKPEFIQLNYDYQAAIDEMHESGLYNRAPWWCFITEQMIRSGRISQSRALNEVMKLCFEKEGSCNWPDIDEKYWEPALRKLYGDSVTYPNVC